MNVSVFTYFIYMYLNATIPHARHICIECLVTRQTFFCLSCVLLHVHVQQGLRYLVCVSVCLPVDSYCHATGYEMAYQQ